jgi:LCP family protein required for cell wall assembly
MPEYRRGHAPRRVAAALPPRRQRFALAVTAVASVMTLLVAGTAWALTSYLNGSLGRVDAGTSGTPASGPVNILVVGIDTRGGLTQKQEAALHVGNSISDNTDTMMLVHIPADHDHIQVVSLPRDSWVDIPGHGMNKINAADAFGGPRLMVQTVEHATGMVINDYVEINFLGFVKVVNALGGVNICLPFAVDDHYSGLHLSAGRHHVNGTVALEFVRDRHSFALSDIARIQDQQQLLSSMLSKATHVGLLANPIRLQEFVSSVSAAVTVDQGFNLIRLADELRGIRPSDVTFRTVPLATMSYLTPTGQDAVLWNKTQAAALFRWLNQDTGTAPPRSTHRAGSKGAAGSKPAAGSTGTAGKHSTRRRRADGKASSGGASTAPGSEHTAAQDACH